MRTLNFRTSARRSDGWCPRWMTPAVSAASTPPSGLHVTGNLSTSDYSAPRMMYQCSTGAMDLGVCHRLCYGSPRVSIQTYRSGELYE